MSWYVYVLECSDESLYTGMTNDFPHRLRMHDRGRVKYTRGRLPVYVRLWEECKDKVSALRCEAAVKRHTRKDKLEFIERKGSLWEKTAQYRKK